MELDQAHSMPRDFYVVCECGRRCGFMRRNISHPDSWYYLFRCHDCGWKYLAESHLRKVGDADKKYEITTVDFATEEVVEKFCPPG